MTAIKIPDKKINAKVEKFLHDNPSIKDSLRLFNIGIESYRKAMEVTGRNKTIISTRSTINEYV